MKKYGKFAALGAIAVSAGVVGLSLLIAGGATPSRGGGIDATHSVIAYIAVAVPAAAIIAAHLAFAKQLFDYASGRR